MIPVSSLAVNCFQENVACLLGGNVFSILGSPLCNKMVTLSVSRVLKTTEEDDTAFRHQRDDCAAPSRLSLLFVRHFGTESEHCHTGTVYYLSRNCYNLCHPEQRTAQHAVATIDVQELLHVCCSRSRQSSTSMCRQWHRWLDLDNKGSEQHVHGRHMQDKISLNKVCKTAWAEGLWDEVPVVWSSRPRLGYSGRRKTSTTSDLRERGPGGGGGIAARVNSI